MLVATAPDLPTTPAAAPSAPPDPDSTSSPIDASRGWWPKETQQPQAEGEGAASAASTPRSRNKIPRGSDGDYQTEAESMNVDTEVAVPTTGELPPSSPMTIESSPSPKRKDTTKESDEESNSSLNEHLRYYGYPTRKSVRTAKAKVISLPPGAAVPTVLEPVGDSRDPSQQRYSETDTVSLASDTKWAKGRTCHARWGVG